VAKRDTPNPHAKTETTKKKTMEAGMTKTEKPKLDEGESSTLSPKAYTEFQRTTDAPGKRIPGLVRAAEKAQGLLKEAD